MYFCVSLSVCVCARSEMIVPWQELKIEEEPSEMPEDDDFLLPAKKKRSRKVDFLEDVDSLSKEGGE